MRTLIVVSLLNCLFTVPALAGQTTQSGPPTKSGAVRGEDEEDEFRATQQVETRTSTAVQLEKQPNAKPAEVKAAVQAAADTARAAVITHPESFAVSQAATKAALQLGDPQSAVQYAGNAVRIAQDHGDKKQKVEALKAQALAYAGAGDEPNANAAAREALKLDPSDDQAWVLKQITESHIKLGHVYLIGETALPTADFERLINSIGRSSRAAPAPPAGEAVAIDPHARGATYTRPANFAPSVADEKQAVGLAQMGDYQAAYDKAAAAVRALPDNAKARLDLATAAYLLGRLDEALAQASEVLKTHPKAADAYMLRAKARNDLLEPRDALADADAALGFNPKLGLAWAARGKARKLLGEPLEAYSVDYKKAMELEPSLSPELSAELAAVSAKASGRAAAPSQPTSGSWLSMIPDSWLAAKLMWAFDALAIIGFVAFVMWRRSRRTTGLGA